MTWPIIKVFFMSKMKLNCYDPSNKVQSMIKTKQDNDMIDRMGVVYA